VPKNAVGLRLQTDNVDDLFRLVPFQSLVYAGTRSAVSFDFYFRASRYVFWAALGVGRDLPHFINNSFLNFQLSKLHNLGKT